VGFRVKYLERYISFTRARMMMLMSENSTPIASHDWMDSEPPMQRSRSSETLWLRKSAIDDRKNGAGNKNDTECKRPLVLKRVGGNSRRARAVCQRNTQTTQLLRVVTRWVLSIV
jgi:hypothetical protein